MAKLKENSIKKKVKGSFGEYEVINPQFKKDTYNKLSQLIRENSTVIKTENNSSDIKTNNIINIFRFMLKELTNIEEDWDNINDEKLDNILNFADGDFKKVINELMDIIIEVGQDNVLNDIRKLTILNNKVVELKESMVSTVNMEKTLSELGLDMDKLMKMQNGDENIIKEFQENIIKKLEKENKPKRKYTRKTK
jgi:hypothetical protein